MQGYWGGTANLTCMADAVPEANFTWTRNNKTIDPELKIINDPNKSVLQVIYFIIKLSSKIMFI